MVILGQSDIIEGGLEAGRLFGFSGLLVLILLAAVGYAMYRVLNLHLDQQAARAEDSKIQSERLIELQTRAYDEQSACARQTQKAVEIVADGFRDLTESIRAVNTYNDEHARRVALVGTRVTNTERMIRESLRLIAERPETPTDVQKDIYRILHQDYDTRQRLQSPEFPPGCPPNQS